MENAKCRSCDHAADAGAYCILAHVGGLPASAPGAVESMTRPVYQRGVRFDSAGAGGWLCPVGAPIAKNTRPGERA